MGNATSSTARRRAPAQSEPVDDGSPPAPLTPLAGPASSLATQNRVDGETPRPLPVPLPSSTAALAAAAPTLDLEPEENDDEDEDEDSSPYAIDLDDIKEAASRIEDHITHTPVRRRRRRREEELF